MNRNLITTARRRRRPKNRIRNRGTPFTIAPQRPLTNTVGFSSPRIRTRLTWKAPGQLLNAGQQNVNDVLVLTDLPLLLNSTSTAIPGMTAYSLIYRFFRVVSARVMLDFSNRETFPVTVYINFTNFATAVNAPLAVALGLLSQPHTVCHELSPVGSNSTVRISRTVGVSQLGGSSDLRAADFYSGHTDGSSSPQNNLFASFGAISSFNLTTAGLTTLAQVSFVVEFFELNSTPD